MTALTTCPYCGVGCGVKVTLDENAEKGFLTLVGDDSHPANFGRLCVKGSNLAETLVHDDRLLAPRIHGEEASWQDAVEHIAKKIQQTVAKHGPDSFAFYLSGQILTEDYYVANKFAKGFIGTANVDTNSRLCMASAVVGYKRAFGSDTVPCNYEDLERCDLLIMVGSNAAWTHPILFQRIAAAKQARPNMKVVVIDPRRTATCDIADLHIAISPGSDAAIFNFLLAETDRRGVLNKKFIKSHTNGFSDALQAVKEKHDVASIAQFCEVTEAQLMALSDLWCRHEKTVTFYSQGVNQSSSGVDKCNAIINCHLATGRIGHEGMGPFSITGQPNAMGGREVGGLANQLAAHMDFATPNAIELVQRFWQAPNMATENGLKAIDMFDAVERGDIKVLWIMSTNPLVSLPDTAKVKRALEKCELVIVSDCKQHTDTANYADVLLPALPWSEKDGTVTNSERRISRQRGLLPARGQAKSDWWAICQVAGAMGFGGAFSYRSASDIFREHAALSGFENNGQRDFDIGYFSDMSNEEYEQLLPIQWPVTKAKPNGTERMFSDGRFFTPNRKANFIPIVARKPVTITNETWPYVLNTGRVRDQWHTMTRTGDAAVLSRHTDQPYVEIHPSDASSLGIEEKSLVRVFSPQGQVLVRAKISNAVKPKSLFVPIHWTRQFANDAVVSSLIPQVVDALSGQPESKHATVNLEPVVGGRYGYIITEEIELPESLTYWCRVKVHAGQRIEFVYTNDQAVAEIKDNVATRWPEGEWLEYQSAALRQTRSVYFVESRPVALIFTQESPDLPASSWLEEQIPLSNAATSHERIALLAGRRVDVEDKGNIVCSCYQVGERQIQKSIDGGCTTLESLGAKLKCGTNCGSCIPEIKQLLPEYEEVL